jgi:hypothetical protein
LHRFKPALRPLRASHELAAHDARLAREQHFAARAQATTLHALKLAMKVSQRRNKRRGADAIDDAPLRGSNVMYTLVDPHAEWLAAPVVLQSEAMLEMQLEHSKDVLAQACSCLR